MIALLLTIQTAVLSERTADLPDGTRVRLSLSRRSARLEWASGRIVEELVPLPGERIAVTGRGRLEARLPLPGPGRYVLTACALPCLQSDPRVASKLRREHSFSRAAGSAPDAERLTLAHETLERRRAALLALAADPETRPVQIRAVLVDLQRDPPLLPASTAALASLARDFENSFRMSGEGDEVPVAMSSLTGERVTPERMAQWLDRLAPIAAEELALSLTRGTAIIYPAAGQ